MSSAMNDVFGHMPKRPDHPDFWRLSEILLGYDSGMDTATDKDEFWESAVAAVINPQSLMYTAMQRASRVFNITTVEDLRAHAKEVAIFTTVWCEGFLLGSDFQTRGGKS
jgi:hypothetical protein